MNNIFLDMVRKTVPNAIAQEIISVQPMPDNIFVQLGEEAMDETELIKAGYKPVSRMNLMWIKDE